MRRADKQKSTPVIGQGIVVNEDYPNGWYKSMEQNIRVLGEKAAAHAWMHDKCVEHYGWWSTRLSVVGMIFSIISGTGALSGFIQDKAPRWILLIFAAMSYVVAIIEGIDKIFDFSGAIMGHKVAFTKYQAIYHSIQKQLALKRADRQNAKDYYTWVLSEIDSLAFYSPDIIGKIQNQYKSRYKSHSVNAAEVGGGGIVMGGNAVKIRYNNPVTYQDVDLSAGDSTTYNTETRANILEQLGNDLKRMASDIATPKNTESINLPPLRPIDTSSPMHSSDEVVDTREITIDVNDDGDAINIQRQCPN